MPSGASWKLTPPAATTKSATERTRPPRPQSAPPERSPAQTTRPGPAWATTSPKSSCSARVPMPPGPAPSSAGNRPGRRWPTISATEATAADLSSREARPAGRTCPIASRPARAGAGPAARGEWGARVRRYLWQPPRPHGEQPRERVVGPLELFYDLAVVVLVAQAAHRLAGHLTWPGLGEFAAVFTLVWIAWANGSLHHDLHGRDDARARSTFLLQILVLAAMGAFIPQAGAARGAAFAVAAAVLFAVLALLWLLAAPRAPPQYRRASRLFITTTAACAAGLAGTAFLPASLRMPAWGLLDGFYLVVFAAVSLTAPPAQGAAVAITDSLTDRFGALIIIVLGEILTGVVAGLASKPV